MRDRLRHRAPLRMTAHVRIARPAGAPGSGPVRHHPAEDLTDEPDEAHPLGRAQRFEHRVESREPVGLQARGVRMPGAREAQGDRARVRAARALEQPGRREPVREAHRAGVRQAEHAGQPVDRRAGEPGVQRQQSGVTGTQLHAVGYGNRERAENVRLAVACMTHTCILSP